jgi:cell division protein FtsZ
MALNNPLIDDYSLKGAKGLLINITGGEDLTLFEVDEIVNKIRAEVDPEAEIINGSIIDAKLEGKIRVSIVATALDGQEPESKSVINMVHRIQNRNTGYSDFSQVNVPSSFNFNSTISNNAVDGANALKLDTEISSEINHETISSNVSEELSTQTQEVVLENKEEEKSNSLILENEYNEEEKASNGLENFQIEDDTPELFDSENVLETENNDQEFSSFVKEQNEDEDELEIPAFLRRQKN